VSSDLRAVLVDVGGTLLPDQFDMTATERAARAQALGRLLLVPDDEARAIADRVFADLATRPGAAGPDFVEAALAALGHSCRGEDLRKVRQSLCVPLSRALEPFPGAGDLLTGIKRLGLGCVVISNTDLRDGEMYQRDFADFGWEDYVDAYVTSVDVGVRKPDRRMFLAALSSVGVAPRQAAMIGNTEEADILPALELGMRTVRVAIAEPAPAETAAERCVTSLTDALEVLQHWAGDLSG
jgi:FMN phosphatase YigB (HAD superfamily)